jgi:hypothetical protein
METDQGSHGASAEDASKPLTRRRARIPERPRREPRRPRFPATAWGRILAVGGCAVAVLILWAITASLLAKPGASLTAAASYKAGDCFSNFDANAEANRTVPCTDAHSAQLVATTSYAMGDSYPGKDALEQRAADLCRQTKLALPSDTSSLKQRNVFPTQDGWATGDRRVDCFVESTAGNSLRTSLLP